MSLDAAKAAARKAAYAARAAADPRAAAAANRHLAAAVRAAPGRVVSGFWPIRTEIDPRPSLAALAATHALCLPVVVAAGRPLAFRAWHPGVDMIPGAFGAAIPADPAERVPQTLVVPLLAFDGRGQRLGYGGGFYDRTIAALRARGPVTAIGFAYAAQRVDAVPADATDQPLDLVVTEDGAFRP